MREHTRTKEKMAYEVYQATLTGIFGPWDPTSFISIAIRVPERLRISAHAPTPLPGRSPGRPRRAVAPDLGSTGGGAWPGAPAQVGEVLVLRVEVHTQIGLQVALAKPTDKSRCVTSLRYH